MNTRTQKALEILAEGGYFRRQLERQYSGREQFKVRLRDKEGRVVKGIGFQTFSALEDKLQYRECPTSSIWPSDYILNNQI